MSVKSLLIIQKSACSVKGNQRLKTRPAARRISDDRNMPLPLALTWFNPIEYRASTSDEEGLCQRALIPIS